MNWSKTYFMLERFLLVERRDGLSVFRAGGWREGLMGDFKASRASRKLSLMWACLTAYDNGDFLFLCKRLSDKIFYLMKRQAGG